MAAQLSFKSLVIAFLTVLVVYLGIFYGLEHWRRRLDPWHIRFAADARDQPMLVINQEQMGVREVKVLFVGERLPAGYTETSLVMNVPRQPLPFGERLHEDLTTWPGVHTFNVFGHVVELAPRLLYVDGRQIPWADADEVTVYPTNKPAEPLPPSKAIAE